MRKANAAYHGHMGFKVRVLPPKSRLVTKLRERDARDMCNAAKKGLNDE